MKSPRHSPRPDSLATAVLLYLLLLIISIFFNACAKQPATSEKSGEQPIATASPAVPASSPTPNMSVTPDDAHALSPPNPAEARGAVARVYGNAVVVDTSSAPGFITGDFNGDGSQDIAIVAKPAKGKLEELNSELANWILEDPRQAAPPDNHSSDAQPTVKAVEPLKVQQNDLLLIVIHGYKQDGWRNAEAKQSYLLRNSVGQMMSAQPVRELQSLAGNRIKLPRQNGDIIRETLSGQQGFIYWTGAKYAWHQMTQKTMG